jgi:autophagy-related protein 101
MYVYPTGVLQTILFHRVFTAIYPSTHDVLDLMLPYVSKDDVESTIETRTNTLLRALDISSGQTSSLNAPTKPFHGAVVVQYLQRKRRKGRWFVSKADGRQYRRPGNWMSL